MEKILLEMQSILKEFPGVRALDKVDLVDSLPSTLAIEDFLLDTHEWIEEIVIVKDPNGYPQPVVAVKADGESQ